MLSAKLKSDSKCRVLIVDDSQVIRDVLNGYLQPLYDVVLASSGEEGLAIALGPNPPDLILLDIRMGGISGFDVCRIVKSHPTGASIPVLFLTASDSSVEEIQALEIGASDFVRKPFRVPVVLARVSTHLQLKKARDALKLMNEDLTQQVLQRNMQLQRSQDIAIHAIASLAETRDNETGYHILRTQKYVRVLAMQLRNNPRYLPELSLDSIELMVKSAPLHDIGKVGIPDRILMKPGKLDADEFEIMKSHAWLGYEALIRAEKELGEEADFLHYAKDIALGHHEKWDGSGYPQGIRGRHIPIAARLMAVADVYDALVSKRCYKPAFGHAEAYALIMEGKGTHFDPEVIDAFEAVHVEMEAIAHELRED